MSDISARSYRPTIRAAYVGYIVQAIVNNFLPLLFITVQRDWDIPLSRITFLITINFLIQLCVDVTSSKLVPKIGYRTAVTIAHFFAAAGMAALGILPFVLPDPYIGILISIFLTAVGGGLIEVIISPIVEACPTEDNKAGQMSFLHSAYCWGHVLVILLSTLYFVVFGTAHWRYMSVVWALVPLINAFVFMKVPIRTLEEESGGSMPIRRLIAAPVFWTLMLMMVCSGAAETAMAQWASDFAEAGLGVSKTLGDLLGTCLFAVLMGVSRVIYASLSDRVDMSKYMIMSSLLCVVGYILSVFSPYPLLSLVGCGIIGFSVGIMWPGSYSIAAAAVKGGGTAMFALLALGGDLGCLSGPTMVGTVAGFFGGELKAGLIWAIIFPIGLIAGLVICLRLTKKGQSDENGKQT